MLRSILLWIGCKPFKIITCECNEHLNATRVFVQFKMKWWSNEKDYNDAPEMVASVLEKLEPFSYLKVADITTVKEFK